MSKTKQKTGSELEHLRGLVKEQAKEIRQLQKQLKSLTKKEHIFNDQDEEVTNDSEDTYPDITYKKLCDGEEGCHKGYFDEYEIMGKIIGTCNVCGRRKKLN